MPRWVLIHLTTFIVLLHVSLMKLDETAYLEDYEPSNDSDDDYQSSNDSVGDDQTYNEDKVIPDKIDSWPIVVAVVSSAKNSIVRSIIRSTWGSVGDQPNVRLAFAVGQSPSTDIRSQVMEEAQKHGDLWVGDFLDTYRNLTLKTIMIIQNALDRHPEASVLLKIDDDCFLNQNALFDFVDGVSASWNDPAIYGMVLTRSKVQRDADDDLYVSYDQFPDKFFSPYMSGSTYIMSMAAAAALRPCVTRHGPGKNLFPVEDVYVTGICADVAGVPRFDRDEFYWDKYERNQVIAIHDIPSEDNFYYWKMLSPDWRD